MRAPPEVVVAEGTPKRKVQSQAKKGIAMSEHQQAMSRERWPLLEAVNMIEMLSYLGTSPLADRQMTDEIEWVITGVWDNTREPLDA